MRTWDGLPVSREKPFGASVVVWRDRGGRREWLILHRLHAGGPDFEDEWAWTPPAGARLPGESVDACARRELREETGLELELASTEVGDDEWAVYVAEAPRDAEIRLDDEHDRFLWLPLDEACKRCLPEQVGRGVRAVAESLERAAADSL